MHWLPLVAMVIASALPFPHSPVPRLVVATTEPGRNLDNHGNNSSNRKHNNNNNNNDNNTSFIHSGRSSRSDNMIRSKAVVDYSSYTNYVHDSPQEDYSGTYVSGTKDMTRQSNIVEDFLPKSRHNQVDYNTPSFIDHIEHKSKGVQKKERHLSKNNPQSKTMQNHNSTEDTHTAEGQLATSNLEDYKSLGNESQNYISLDNHTPEEYKSQPGVSSVNRDLVDITRKGNHYPLSTTKENIADVSVRQNYNPYNGGTVKKEMSLDTTTQTEHYNYPEKQMEVESDGKGVDGGSERRWGLGMEVGREKLLEEAELLFLDAHPRVLFTPSSSPPNHPPLLLMLEAGLQAEVGERVRERGEEQEDGQGERSMDMGGETEMELWTGTKDGKVGGSVLTDTFTDSRVRRRGGEPPYPKTRPKRASAAHDKRGERSVCEVANEWVTDKKTAIDILGNTVMVLPEIQTPRGPLKQYFFETKCRQPDARATGGSGVSGRDCVGVDKKHWVSECKAKQSYVRALTAHPQKGVGWRWIRIDSSCVCVLQARVTRN
ncbi:hypothetical protein AAFF_G00366050 [Aldrovandia affinis]|uniref:Nerve growth factor-related domain-containing protein n=1 Tax=Aldrovandia affinis TaxID=143900 RepID=A0AAD7WMN3_9TELE|nr:hypothetical protein AAFF_G00366050 [Aldrovandia affinis]